MTMEIFVHCLISLVFSNLNGLFLSFKYFFTWVLDQKDPWFVEVFLPYYNFGVGKSLSTSVDTHISTREGCWTTGSVFAHHYDCLKLKNGWLFQASLLLGECSSVINSLFYRVATYVCLEHDIDERKNNESEVFALHLHPNPFLLQQRYNTWPPTASTLPLLCVVVVMLLVDS